MKRFWIVAVMCLAQAGLVEADNRFGIHASYWDNAEADGSEGVGFFLTTSAANEGHLVFDFRATWYQDISDEPGTELEVIPIELGFTAHSNPGGRFDAYIGGGIGWNLMEGTTERALGGKSKFKDDGEFGYYAVLGTELTIGGSSAKLEASRICLFVEGMYRGVDIGSVDSGVLGEDPSNGDLSGGVVQAGIVFHW